MASYGNEFCPFSVDAKIADFHYLGGSLIGALLVFIDSNYYHFLVDMGDHVVVINTKSVVLTGKKWDDKLYRHHTG